MPWWFYSVITDKFLIKKSMVRFFVCFVFVKWLFKWVEYDLYLQKITFHYINLIFSMIQYLIVKFTTANAVRLANAVVRPANAGRTPPFGRPGGLSVRLPHLTHIRSRHGPRLFGVCNISPLFKVLRLGKLISAFLKPCSKSLHLLSFVSNAVVDNQRKFLKKV